MIKKSPYSNKTITRDVPRRETRTGDDDVNGIIYPPTRLIESSYLSEGSERDIVVEPILFDDSDHTDLPLAPAILIEPGQESRDEEESQKQETLSDGTFALFSVIKKTAGSMFRPIHPQCEHMSCACVALLLFVFVGIGILLKSFFGDMKSKTISPSIVDISSSPSLFPSSSPTVFTTSSPSLFPSSSPTVFPTSSPSLFPSSSPTIFSTSLPTTKKSHGDKCLSNSDCKSKVCGFPITSDVAMSGNSEKVCCDDIWKFGICKAREWEGCDPDGSDTSCMNGLFCARKIKGYDHSYGCCKDISYCPCSDFLCDCCNDWP